MSQLSCDTPFIGQIETHDLSRYHGVCTQSLRETDVRTTIMQRAADTSALRE